MNEHDRVVAALTAKQRRDLEARHSSVDGIAAELGVGRRAVRRAGVTPRRPRNLRDYTTESGGRAALAAYSEAERARIESEHSSLKGIAEVVGVSPATLSRAGWVARLPNPSNLPPEGFGPPRPSATAVVPSEALADIEALWRRYYASVVTLRGMQRWASENGIPCPSLPGIYHTLRRAGITADDFYARNGAAPPRSRGREFTDDECAAAVRLFIDHQRAHDRPVTIAEYERWSAKRPDTPREATVRHAHGALTWAEIVAACLDGDGGAEPETPAV